MLYTTSTGINTTPDKAALIMMRQTGRRPRLHPNHFIQFDLTPDGLIRLHVWPDERLQAQQTRHPIHDHSFDMLSTILCGALTNLVYQFIPAKDGDYFDTLMHQATRLPDTQDTVLTPCVDGRGVLWFESGDVHCAGQSYCLDKAKLHDSIPHGLTATLMRKNPTQTAYGPLIAVPRGVSPDNAFRRETIDEEILWKFIERALLQAYHCWTIEHVLKVIA